MRGSSVGEGEGSISWGCCREERARLMVALGRRDAEIAGVLEPRPSNDNLNWVINYAGPYEKHSMAELRKLAKERGIAIEDVAMAPSVEVPRERVERELRTLEAYVSEVHGVDLDRARPDWHHNMTHEDDGLLDVWRFLLEVLK